MYPLAAHVRQDKLYKRWGKAARPWLPGGGLQEQPSNHLTVLRLNERGIERIRKRQAIETCQVSAVKMSESEPSMKHRNKQIVTKTSVC